jgi:hypothetical protein
MTLDRPFVDQRVEDIDRAGWVAARAAAAWNLPRPELLRRGMNGIFACGDVVLRVGRATGSAASSHELARVLADHGVPVVTPIAGAALDADDYAVTAWERVEPMDVPVDWPAVGTAVRRIHELDVAEIPDGYPAPAPTTFPWWDFDTMLGAVSAHIDDRALEGLSRTIDAGRWWTDAIEEGWVVCHGDVHPGNVLMSGHGPLLIDFDLLCRAAPAWDHAMLTTYADRWGGDPGVYPAFAGGYGRSLGGDPLTETIAALRNVAATLMRVRAGITDDGARVEAERRLRFWRGDPDAPQWLAQ